MPSGAAQVGTSDAATVEGALTQPVSPATAATGRVQRDHLGRCFMRMRLRLRSSGGGRRHADGAGPFSAGVEHPGGQAGIERPHRGRVHIGGLDQVPVVGLGHDGDLGRGGAVVDADRDRCSG